nr:MFS transporter [Sphingomonas sp. Y57]
MTIVAETPVSRASAGLGARAYWGQLLVLASAMAAAGHARTALSPLQEAMRLDLGFTDTQMALLQGAVIGAPIALSAIPLGLAIDRWNRKRLLIALVLLSALGSALTAVLSDFTALAVARCLAGVAALSIVPVVLSLVSDLAVPEQRGGATTVAIVGQVAGNAAAFALGGALLTALPSADGSWRITMGWLTVPLLPVALLLLILREPARAQGEMPQAGLGAALHGLRGRRRALAAVTLGIMLTETAIGAILIWAAPFLARQHALPPDQIGTLMALTMLASGLIGPLLGGLLADRSQRVGGPRLTLTMLAGLSLLAAPLAAFGWVSSTALVATLLICSATMLLAIAVMGIALFTILAPPAIRGLCSSLLMAGILLFSLGLAPSLVSETTRWLGGEGQLGAALSLIGITASPLAALVFGLGSRRSAAPNALATA